MKWYNRDFDYIHEFIESWNRKLKKLKRTFIVIAILSIALFIEALSMKRI